MSRRSAPVLGMSIILVLVLTVAGVAFTAWTGSVLLNGAATTAGVKLEWDGTVTGCALTSVTFVSPTAVELSRVDAVQGDTDLCVFTYQNNGTVPVAITAINETGQVPGEFSFVVTDGIGTVLQPGDTKIIQVEYLVEAGALPFTTYNFSVEIVGEQS